MTNHVVRRIIRKSHLILNVKLAGKNGVSRMETPQHCRATSGHRKRNKRSPSALLSPHTLACPKLIEVGARGEIDRSTWPEDFRAQTKPNDRHYYPSPHILRSYRESGIFTKFPSWGDCMRAPVIADDREVEYEGQEARCVNMQIVR